MRYQPLVLNGPGNLMGSKLGQRVDKQVSAKVGELLRKLVGIFTGNRAGGLRAVVTGVDAVANAHDGDTRDVVAL